MLSERIRSALCGHPGSVLMTFSERISSMHWECTQNALRVCSQNVFAERSQYISRLHIRAFHQRLLRTYGRCILGAFSEHIAIFFVPTGRWNRIINRIMWKYFTRHQMGFLARGTGTLRLSAFSSHPQPRARTFYDTHGQSTMNRTDL